VDGRHAFADDLLREGDFPVEAGAVFPGYASEGHHERPLALTDAVEAGGAHHDHHGQRDQHDQRGQLRFLSHVSSPS
jgi:hypothetical protein